MILRMRHTRRLISLFFAIMTAALAQDAALENASPNSPGNSPAEDKSVFGVIPNNRTTEGSLPFIPITAKYKMTIASKDSFDWPVYPTAGAFAMLYQLDNQNPSFGQGMAGYARRLGTASADQVIGNMMTEGIVPSLLHLDPRYFRVGEGSRMSRLRKSLVQIVWTRTDSGAHTFNFAEWGGNAAGVAISNAYYPDTRDVSDNVQKLLVACATDAFSNVLKEFWPDVKRYFQRKREAARERELQSPALTQP